MWAHAETLFKVNRHFPWDTQGNHEKRARRDTVTKRGNFTVNHLLICRCEQFATAAWDHPWGESVHECITNTGTHIRTKPDPNWIQVNSGNQKGRKWHHVLETILSWGKRSETITVEAQNKTIHSAFYIQVLHFSKVTLTCEPLSTAHWRSVTECEGVCVGTLRIWTIRDPPQMTEVLITLHWRQLWSKIVMSSHYEKIDESWDQPLYGWSILSLHVPPVCE